MSKQVEVENCYGCYFNSFLKCSIEGNKSLISGSNCSEGVCSEVNEETGFPDWCLLHDGSMVVVKKDKE